MVGKVNFGIVGTGVIAPFHAEAISRLRNEAKLVAIVGSTEAKAKAFGRKYGAKKGYSDYDKLLNQDDIDAIIICTPHHLHASMAKTALEKNKHVLVEKPIAINLKEADDLIDRSRKTNAKLAVGFQSRFNKNIALLKRKLMEGVIGRTIIGSASMRWHRSEEYFNRKKWTGKQALAGGGVLMNQAIHLIDLLHYFLGSVVSVSCLFDTLTHEIEVEDTSAAILRFRNRSLGLIEATISIKPSQSPFLNICGDKGSAYMDFDITRSWQARICQEIVTNFQDKRKTIEFSRETTSIDDFVAQIGDLIYAIRNDVEPHVNGEEGRKSLEIVRALYISGATRKVVKLPLLNDEIKFSYNNE